MSQEGNQIIVHGRVQMVGFRYATVEQAQQLGLTGHAINLKNGDVEVQVFGDKTERDKLILWLREGPDAAQVDALEITAIDYKKLPNFTQG
ncbi:MULTISPECIES: acylphosphatase [unclassified Moritella]|uniref:acylphosphatase n=1 Tax=unclassified Moritella TaxID=2637987 RepID=UPI001BAE0DE7|nr:MULTISPECIES: acylphosphatase [unclassified Moritella]QUM81368.1 acylphosphatase [Moritella sp. 5]QUM85688.1 acylphosphatase [Moritella sp. 28]QUM89906.1 acylphosphatase [Moritella sp. 36]